MSQQPDLVIDETILPTSDVPLHPGAGRLRSKTPTCQELSPAGDRTGLLEHDAIVVEPLCRVFELRNQYGLFSTDGDRVEAIGLVGPVRMRHTRVRWGRLCTDPDASRHSDLFSFKDIDVSR